MDAPSHPGSWSSNIPEKPLSTIYSQVSQGLPAAILGVRQDATLEEVRQAFRSLALWLHPDKVASEDLRELHTKLFQNVQSAYEQLLLRGVKEKGQVKALPETWEALHARNVEFKEKLKAARKKAKNVLAAERDAKEARQKKIGENAARKRQMRAAAKEAAEAKARDADEKRRAERKKNARRVTETPDDWETAEDEMEERHMDAPNFGAARMSKPKSAKPLRNKPTADNATPIYDRALDENLVSESDIKRRWYKQLVSGGGKSGSVSLAEKTQRENNSAARMLAFEKKAIAAADQLKKPALLGNRTFSGTAEDEILQRVTDMETEIKYRVERRLAMMDRDVVQEHVVQKDDAGAWVPFRPMIEDGT